LESSLAQDGGLRLDIAVDVKRVLGARLRAQGLVHDGVLARGLDQAVDIALPAPLLDSLAGLALVVFAHP
jgi:hypothetical protein